MGEMIDVHVPGIPRPQGSKRHIGNGRFIEANAEVLMPWRATIAATVQQALPEGWDPGRIYTVAAVFTWQKLKTRDDKYRASPPDVDKLLRAVLDACTTAGAWRDDGRVVEVRAVKMYSEHPGLQLRIGYMQQ